MSEFSEAVCMRIGNYVYRLIDPRNGETFYVGKGKGNRVFQHAKGIQDHTADERNGLNPKYDRIREIKNAGLDVLHVIHRHEIPEESVLEVEAAVIDAYAGLTNLQGGFGSDSKGPMNHRQIIDKYDLPELEDCPSEKLILININALEDRSNVNAIYDQVRYAWRISPTKAEKADYVLAVIRGVIVGAFVAERWMPASRQNFEDILRATSDNDGRYGFVGHPAPKDIWDRFVGKRGKRITNDGMKHIQNPIRYWNI